MKCNSIIYLTRVFFYANMVELTNEESKMTNDPSDIPTREEDNAAATISDIALFKKAATKEAFNLICDKAIEYGLHSGIPLKDEQQLLDVIEQQVGEYIHRVESDAEDILNGEVWAK